MRVIKNILLVLLTLASISLYSQSDLDGTVKTDTTSGNFFNGGTAFKDVLHSGAGNYDMVWWMWDSLAMTSIGGSGFVANPTGNMTLYGKLFLNGFGAGSKEASDLGVTHTYNLGVASDGTVLEYEPQFVQARNFEGENNDVDNSTPEPINLSTLGIVDTIYASSAFTIDDTTQITYTGPIGSVNHLSANLSYEAPVSTANGLFFYFAVDGVVDTLSKVTVEEASTANTNNVPMEWVHTTTAGSHEYAIYVEAGGSDVNRTVSIKQFYFYIERKK